MKLKFLGAMAIAAMTVIGCTKDKKEGAEASKNIEIGYVDGWAEGVAMTHIADEILTENGYEVTTKKAAVDLVFASLSNGDTDVFMDTWLPVTHKEKVTKFEGKIEKLGVNYDNAKIGLVVPAYVDVNSIEELNANADKFDGKIIGIEKGAGITAKTDEAIKEYGLKLEQLNSSSIAMLTELQKAIGEKRPIVVAGWAPHWKFGRFELKFLTDTKKVYGESETIETYARKGFKAEDKFAATFFANFHLDEAQMADLLAKMEEGEDKQVVAKKWVADHKDMVDTWIGTAK